MPTKKTLGEPDAGNPQVRFDEGALETEPWPKRGTGMLRKQPETATPRSYSHRASALLRRLGGEAAGSVAVGVAGSDGVFALGPGLRRGDGQGDGLLHSLPFVGSVRNDGGRPLPRGA